MCGICFMLRKNRGHDDNENPQFQKCQLLHNRGPDVYNNHIFQVNKDFHACMQGYVLHLRGSITPQPLVDEQGNSLLWNGEIFGGIEVRNEENDTAVLFKALKQCSSKSQLLSTIQQVEGPWAFIFWQMDQRTLWFGRDIFGRRSLLWHLPCHSEKDIIISSVVARNKNYSEIPSVGIFSIKFPSDDDSELNLMELTLHPWHGCVWPGSSIPVRGTPTERIGELLFSSLQCNISVKIDDNQLLSLWIPQINMSIPNDYEGFSILSPEFNNTIACKKDTQDEENTDEYPDKIIQNIMKSDTELDKLSDELIKVLQKAVKIRVSNIPKTAHPVSQTSQLSKKTSEMNISDKELPDSSNEDNLLQDHEYSCAKHIPTTKSRVAILFSGGLDSSVLAALADRCVPKEETIDLLNVAFEQNIKPPQPVGRKQKQRKTSRTAKFKNQEEELKNRITKCSKEDQEPFPCNSSIPEKFDDYKSTASHSFVESETSNSVYDVPDRITGRLAFSELNPSRNWNFIEINVTQKELEETRKEQIQHLIYPLRTVLDDSIGCAVWFAARGIGILTSDKKQKVRSNARVLFCGMAADEQFVGYSRHRVTFKKFGWSGVVNEIQEEIWRISARNLGRDDRIITDHGKEARFPFLDEKFTKFVSNIPVYKRADLHLPRGIGEKLLLRISALKLGLIKTACQPKRAIQFGSKIAKMDNSKEKGSHVCSRLS